MNEKLLSEENKPKTPFQIFEQMSEDGNNEIKSIPFSNIKSAISGKDGWGTLSLAIPNECVPNFVLGNYAGMLVFTSFEEYEKYKNNN